MSLSEKILVVDDIVDNVALLSKRLVSQGYRVVEAYDGEEALKKVYEESPDLIILDIMMPKIDGFEVCKRLKLDQTTRRIPIIMLTAKREVPDKIKGIDIGADDYITKPFNPHELMAKVKALLARKAIEQKQATAEKLGALGQMAEGVAHEVRNPMVSIGGFARRIRDKLNPGDPLREYAEHIIKEAERLERMVAEIARFQELMIAPFTQLNICHILEETLELWKDRLDKDGIKAEIRSTGTCDFFKGDRRNLIIAFSNIIKNSIEAISREGKITISYGQDPDNEKMVLITFEDNGKGIPRKELPNVMDPFFTSKVVGAGMGLTMVHRIVTRHGGEVEINSEEGVGTVVKVRLPKAPVESSSDE